ncbi:MAG: hypothetical protein ACSHXB_18985 [Sulfitobacter sp.]
MNPSPALSSLPISLRDPLLNEYQNIVGNFAERRWSPTELSGGLFCEIVFTILEGHSNGSYAGSPSKPSNFVSACRQLEQNTHVPRSFQILIPRLLPALYEVRNNRGVGHVGGDVDPNHMDATFVLSSANWIMGELVRVFHSSQIDDAQKLVDQLSEVRIPLIWQKGKMRRVLNTSLKQNQQILVLLASAGSSSVNDLVSWMDVTNRTYFKRVLRSQHKERLIEFDETAGAVELLPPGSAMAAEIVRQFS